MNPRPKRTSAERMKERDPEYHHLGVKCAWRVEESMDSLF
jgi:hypothetical protein